MNIYIQLLLSSLTNALTMFRAFFMLILYVYILEISFSYSFLSFLSEIFLRTFDTIHLLLLAKGAYP